MDSELEQIIGPAKDAALEVLRHNRQGPCQGLPRTAGWGYPEPYTRDLMISALGILVSDDSRLIAALRRTLEVLARHQSQRGHIPSLVHDPEDRGASDCTPLFLLAAGCLRRATGESSFLAEAVDRALGWMEYQSPADRHLVAQLPTSDWRDEQWVLGYGLYVNTVLYSALRLLGRSEWAEGMADQMGRFTIQGGRQNRHVHEGLALRRKPYYAMWSYKIYRSERFDLLGNSLAVLSGIASPHRSRAMVTWIEAECRNLRRNDELAVSLPPNLFPYIRPDDPDWRDRYQIYNQPGEYHNGGIWPFVCGFYVAACVAAGKMRLARRRLAALTELVTPARRRGLAFGFNEWIKAQTGEPMGQDWQTWSAAMYLYAAACVEQERTPFFEDIRNAV
jgi:hypothetical protein